jgi:predicted negative regulator of RcsB-dependent stress response
VDRITRKELKQDKFALEVGQTVEYVSAHRKQLIRYGTAAALVLLAVSSIYAWRRHSAAEREEALGAALEIQQTEVGAPAGPSGKVFSTEQAKTKAEIAAFTDVAAKYPDSEQGAIAQYYLGTIAANDGNMKAAEQALKEVINSGYTNYASLAKLSLAQIYKAQGKISDGETLIRSVMDHPTNFVSKDEATIALARLIMSTKPAEARKLLEPLRAARPAISRYAMSELSAMPAQ